MKSEAIRHPTSLCVIAIRRNLAAQRHGSFIEGAAVFSVVKCRDWGARFSLEARSFDETHSRAQIIDGIVQRMALGATVLSSAQLHPDYPVHRVDGSSPPAAANELTLIERARPDIEMLWMPYSPREMAYVTAAYDIGSPMGARIRPPGSQAGLEAQALWLYFLWTRCRPKERNWLASGWEAWRAIERARALV
ncbi:hypothetical protein ACIGGE_12400 [Qipengyuania sp. NPDC077410]|uniref:hypothetical protein n=1 Tax=Qipengyuania sp. NPDC077410 TaxID=3364496 RepID=UPI0037CA1F08